MRITHLKLCFIRQHKKNYFESRVGKEIGFCGYLFRCNDHTYKPSKEKETVWCNDHTYNPSKEKEKQLFWNLSTIFSQLILTLNYYSAMIFSWCHLTSFAPWGKLTPPFDDSTHQGPFTQNLQQTKHQMGLWP